jgi:hypothetical protein
MTMKAQMEGMSITTKVGARRVGECSAQTAAE